MSDPTIHLSAPRYRQVEEHLTRQIYDGVYPAGALMPTDAELQRMYSVSRITIRHALDNMVRNNLITRRQGVGTFANGPDLSVKTANLFAYLDEIHPYIDIRLVSFRSEVPPPSVAALLGFSAEQACACLTGVNHTGSKKLSYVRDFLPDAIAGLISEADFQGHTPIATLLETRSGVDHSHAEQTMGAVAAPPEVAEALGLQPGHPVMRMERAYYINADRVRYVSEAYYHPDRYHYSVRIVRRGSAAPPRRMPGQDGA